MNAEKTEYLALCLKPPAKKNGCLWLSGAWLGLSHFWEEVKKNNNNGAANSCSLLSRKRCRLPCDITKQPISTASLIYQERVVELDFSHL